MGSGTRSVKISGGGALQIVRRTNPTRLTLDGFVLPWFAE